MTEENIVLQRKEAINKTLSILLNLLLIYFLFLLFHKINKKEKSNIRRSHYR